MRASWEPAEQLTAIMVEAVRLRYPALASLTLFPRSLLHLHLHSCALVNQGATSPFHSIKRHLPPLATLTFTNAN